jgi:TolA-binding protein
MLAVVVAAVIPFGFLQPSPATAAEGSVASAEAAKAAYAAAAALQNRDEWDLAAEEWESLVKRFPGDPLAGKAWYYLGICRSKTKRFTDAAAAFARAADAPGDAETAAVAAFERGRALYAEAQAGRAAAYAEAASALGGFVAKHPKHPKVADAISLEAEALWQAGRKAEAVERWKAFVALKDMEGGGKAARLPDVLYALGVGLAELGRKEEALAAFDAFAKNHAAHQLAKDVMIWRGDLLLQLSRPAEAERLLASPFPETDSERPEVLERLARARYAQKKHREAAEAYARLATRFPDAAVSKAAAMSAAIAFLDAKETGRAKEWFAKVEAAGGPRAVEAAHLLATLELEAGRAAEALAVADRALARKPTDRFLPAVLLDRADALWELPDRRADAAKAYATVIERFPDDAAARTALAMLAAAELRLDRPDEALARADAFLKRYAAGSGSSEAITKQVIEDVRRVAAESLLAIAAKKSKSGDRAAATAALERLVRDFPGSQRIDLAWYRLGELREQAGNHAGAIEAFGKCRAAKPDGDRAAWALLAIGWAHEAAGRPDDASKAWTELVEKAAASEVAASALLARADLRQRRGDFKGAIADARAAAARPLEADAKREAAVVEALSLVGDGRGAEAMPILAKLRRELPPNAAVLDRVLFELAIARLGDSPKTKSDGAPAAEPAKAEAEKDLRELVERFPRSPLAADAWLELGELAWGREDYAKAAGAYQKAIDAKPEPATLEQAAHRLGWTAVLRKDHAAAIPAFERQLAAAASGPLAADGWCMLGESRFKTGQFDRAAEAFARALADPEKISGTELRELAVVRASDCAARAGKFEESLARARELLAKSADSTYAPQARYAAGWALQNLGRFDEALVEYRAVADGSRSELAARARLMEGEVLFEKGQHAEAIKAFFKTAYGYGEKAAPPEYHPWQAQATFEAARCFEALGKPAQARKLYAELLERYPDSQQSQPAKKRLDSFGPS